MTCNEPGCGGTIASDNYCDTCGAKNPGVSQQPPPPSQAKSSLPPGQSPVASPARSVSAGSPAATPPAPQAKTICGTNACEGTIFPDGYCDTCGLRKGPAQTIPGSSAGPSSIPLAFGSQSKALGVPEPILLSTRLPGAGTATARSRLTTSSARTASTRSAIGVGLIDVPATPVGDPGEAVMSDDKIATVLGEVAEAERFCSSCGRPVGRGTEEKPGRVKGFCGTCRTAFDFVTNEPALEPGEMVGGQYEILGPLAHGGMGWIYLGRDKRVSDRWVVLKGLLNEEDPDAALAAVAERRFLAQIEHANIVNIYNFVTHKGAGYIVMEMVGGQSLNSKLKERRQENGGAPSPLPVAQAVAYVLGILGAFDYLHGLGLVYNDLKPANIMALGDQVKLIDVGAVMKIDDPSAAIFGTQGFQAPEVAEMGPSVASDLYTVGRTLAVLILNFVFHTGEFVHQLPDMSQEPLFARYESLYRFLLRATAQHPDDRFQSATEMATQLTGVLRQIVAIDTGQDHPMASTHFGADQLTTLLIQDSEAYDVSVVDWRVLPHPKVDPADEAAAFLYDLPELDPERSLGLLQTGLEQGTVPDTREFQLRVARETNEGGSNPAPILARLEQIDPWDWRPAWQRAVFHLRRGAGQLAAEGFNRVWTELPGELAPQLGIALSAEVAQEYTRAAQLYSQVIAADSSFVSAAFGLARCHHKMKQPGDAVNALNRVPASSAAHYEAQVAAAHALIAGEPTLTELKRASASIERLQLDAAARADLSADVYERTLEGIAAGRIDGDSKVGLLGSKLTERDLRRGLEKTYRARARFAATAKERADFVDKANRARPRTLF